MRRCSLRIGLILLLVPASLTAQRARRWSLDLGLAMESFHGASRDTSSLASGDVEVFPSPRVAVELGVGRRMGRWELGIGAGYASGNLRARTDALVVDDRTTPVRRYRAAILIGRRLTGLGQASLHLIAGPQLDHWTTSGLGDRTTFSGRGGLALRIPLGPADLENRVMFGVGSSTFARRDLPPEAKLEALRWWSVGATLRWGL